MENLGKDLLGREGIRAGDKTFTVIKTDPFNEWREKKVSAYEWGKLSAKNKKKLFLRWKWLSDNDDANEECEATRRSLVSSMDEFDLNLLDEGGKYFWDTVKAWEKRCYEIQKEIGVIDTPKDHAELPKEVHALASQFGGKVVSRGWADEEN